MNYKENSLFKNGLTILFLNVMKYLLFYVYTVFMFPSLINSIWNFCITIFSLSWVELNKNKSNYLFQERGGAKLPEWNTDGILHFRAIFSIYGLTISNI